MYYRTEPRFRSNDSLSSDLNTLNINPTPIAQSRRTSYVGNLNSSHTSAQGVQSNVLDKIQNSKSKLPKDIVEILDKRLLKLMQTHNSPYTPDDVSRRIFLVFFNSLKSPTVATAIKQSRSSSDLLMFFLKDASKELRSYNEKTQSTGPTDPSYYLPNFIRFLVDLLRDKGYSTSHASLIKELESFKAASSKGQTLRATNRGNTIDSAATGQAGPEKKKQLPTFQLQDMAIAKHIAVLFGLSQEQIQRKIQSLKDDATEKTAVAELKFLRDELEIHNRHPIYSRSDFHSESTFMAWKTAELLSLNQQVNHFIQQNSSLATVLPYSPEAGKVPSYTYIPPDPRSFYRVLVELCLKQSVDSHSDLILSKESSDLLLKVTNAWRISAITRGLIFLNVSAALYEKGIYSLEKLSNDVMVVTSHQLLDSKKDLSPPETWPESDKAIAYCTMRSLHEFMVDKIVLLLRGIYEKTRPEIKPYMSYMAENFDQFSSFEGYPELEPSPAQVTAIKEVVIGAAQDKYSELVAALQKNPTISYVHVVEIAHELNRLAELVKKRYPGKLMGISVAKLALKDNYQAFGQDCDALVQYLLNNQTPQTEMSLGQIGELYATLCETRMLYMKHMRADFPFDIETRLEPYVSVQFQAAFDKPVAWVDGAIGNDSFQLPPLPDTPSNPYETSAAIPRRTTFFTSSVADMFSSINNALGLISNIQWDHPVHVAVFYTIAMKVSYKPLSANFFIFFYLSNFTRVFQLQSAVILRSFLCYFRRI